LIKPQSIKNKLTNQSIDFSVIHQEYDQLHLIVNDVKLTFFTFPYKIEKQEVLDDIIGMPGLLNLAAMKALALGGRAKWKDYVDLYFLLKNYWSLKEIERKAIEIFGNAFSTKLFRQQLSYFNDIDYSEAVEYLVKQPSEKEIKEFLTETALEVL